MKFAKNLRKFFGFMLLTLGLGGLLGASSVQAAQCKGMSKSKCESSECTWVKSYKSKSGSTVNAYCRSKPSKSSSKKQTSSKSKDDKKKSTDETKATKEKTEKKKSSSSDSKSDKK